MPDPAEFFAANGPLARTIPGFRPRPQQVAMARLVAEAIGSCAQLVVEAGTGTGKTLAYLVPALTAGGKVIISTGTKTLQDQLFLRDIPAVRAALGLPVTVAMLKGRANYVCHYHLERACAEGRFFDRRDARLLPHVERFARTSDSGDKAACSSVPESATVWNYVTSTRDNCLGSECPYYRECFVMEARRRALAADVVVVNHHLFCADLALREGGVAELLPAANTVILDEAHQLPEIASLFFGSSITAGQLLELARDSRSEALAHARDATSLPEAAQALEKAVREVRLTLPRESWRAPLERALAKDGFEAALDALAARLCELEEALAAQAERAPGLENCRLRTQTLAQGLRQWRTHSAGEVVRWVEASPHGFQLNGTPLSVADTLRSHIEGQARAWIFTSATLAVKGDFSHYQRTMGLEAARTAAFDSPFDYASQALLYVPQGLPEPNRGDYTQAVVEAALPILRAAGGRAFLLFTTLKAMTEAHGLLEQAFAREGLDFPLLLQGEGTRTALLERFRRLGNAVLVASQSFWEGVDVPGAALSVVVIDRLPFAPPDDPVLAARIERLNREGCNAFMEYQLPHAVITLKQGAGRLIRSETDRGVLMICDPRLIDKAYGRRIWQSLPPMRRTREQREAERFFEEAPRQARLGGA
ncbi:ATP-dependent DNA helicase [Thiobacter aerophilum]|uniref:ATP-dependent DNA helicase n=1 Tax=Thiobacter aerophilum TaxID=3121275 RepID=A0ABV0EAW8_9BURK